MNTGFLGLMGGGMDRLTGLILIEPTTWYFQSIFKIKKITLMK